NYDRNAPSHRRGATTASGVARPITASVSRVFYRRGFRPLRSDLSADCGVLAAMALYKLVAVIKNPSDEDFLVVHQAPPPPLPEEEYRSFVDSDLWDLPSAPLNPLGGDRRSETVVEGACSLLDDLDLEKFDVDSALDEEYPPGITLVPMKSRTREPFHTTNLIVVVADDAINEQKDSSFVTYGNSLLVDPGCSSRFHPDLADLVAKLPRKLVVFVTHHHYDHVDGLSVIQKCNPDAVLLAHENTSRHIGRGEWSLCRTLISGGEKIQIGDHRFEVIVAPGHTDGHLALLHVSTNSLIVGDHCVGQGSAVLDVRAGGNLKDYFQTTYRFLDLSPHVLIPMHGRINLWPKQMLCGYLKHRRDRELSILNAIENGSKTLFDIISKSYADVDIKFWLPASSNVRIHVDHLAYQEKLPKDFSMEDFIHSYEMFLEEMGMVIPQPSLQSLEITGAVTSHAIKTSSHCSHLDPMRSEQALQTGTTNPLAFLISLFWTSISFIRRSNVFDTLRSLSESPPTFVTAFANTRIDRKETPEAHVLKADLPGVEKAAEAEGGMALRRSSPSTSPAAVSLCASDDVLILRSGLSRQLDQEKNPHTQA
ncbi:Metallo-beta-lactamase superfamily, partial [Musa troglodytarum]